MHIHLNLSNMAESQYLSPSAQSNTDSMQVDTAVASTSCSTRPATTAAAYTTADLTPYSAVRMRYLISTCGTATYTW